MELFSPPHHYTLNPMELFLPIPHHHHRCPAAAAAAASAAANPIQTPTPLSSLIAALDHATNSAKHLPSSPDPSAALAALRSAHQMLNTFLSNIPPPVAPVGDEQMSEAEERLDDRGEESNLMEEVEEGIRECAIRSKRLKRRASPSWIRGRSADLREGTEAVRPMDRRQAALDLVFQFHA